MRLCWRWYRVRAIAVTTTNCALSLPDVRQCLAGAGIDTAGGSAPLNLIYHHAIDLNVPVACGGVAVYAGDIIIIVGDEEGVAVIPQHLADEVARDAAEQEVMEVFILERVRGGAALPGTDPPNAETRAALAVWRKARKV